MTSALFSRSPDSPGDLHVEPDHGEPIVVRHAVAEQMRLLAKRIDLANRSPLVVAVCGTLAGEGVSSTAQALAITVTHDTQRRACVVDCDWEAGATSDAGSLADVVTGSTPIAKVLESTSIERLKRVAAGPVPLSEQAAAANSEAFESALETLRETFDLVVLDVPPLRSATHTLTLAAQADLSVLVVRQGGVAADLAEQSINDLGRDHVAGVVLNGARGRLPAWLTGSSAG